MATATALGTDIAVFPDLGKRHKLVSGRACVAEAVLKRLMTPRGKLHYAPDYGYDLRRFLNEAQTPALLSTVRSGVVAEVSKDDRVLSVGAKVTYDEATEKLTVELSLSDADGPFKLIVAADADLVTLLALE